MRVRCLTLANAIRDAQESGASENRTRARCHLYFSEYEFRIAEAPWSEAERAVALLFVEVLQAQPGRQAR